MTFHAPAHDTARRARLDSATAGRHRECHNRTDAVLDAIRPAAAHAARVGDRSLQPALPLLHARGGVRLAAAGGSADLRGDRSARRRSSSALGVDAGAAHRRRAAAAPRSARPRRAGSRARPGLDERALTTNGVHLAAQAAALRAAGLDRVTVSLDTLRRRSLRAPVTLARSRRRCSPASRPPSRRSARSRSTPWSSAARTTTS